MKPTGYNSVTKTPWQIARDHLAWELDCLFQKEINKFFEAHPDITEEEIKKLKGTVSVTITEGE
jgi:hypothetical protein